MLSFAKISLIDSRLIWQWQNPLRWKPLRHCLYLLGSSCLLTVLLSLPLPATSTEPSTSSSSLCHSYLCWSIISSLEVITNLDMPSSIRSSILNPVLLFWPVLLPQSTLISRHCPLHHMPLCFRSVLLHINHYLLTITRAISLTSSASISALQIWSTLLSLQILVILLLPCCLLLLPFPAPHRTALHCTADPWHL